MSPRRVENVGFPCLTFCTKREYICSCATGITPDEPTELEYLLDMIIALEESGEAELQETQGTTASKKRQYDRAKVKDVRLKAMEKLSETKKRGSSEDESDDKPKRQPRSEGDAIEQSTNKAFLGLP